MIYSYNKPLISFFENTTENGWAKWFGPFSESVLLFVK